MNLSSHKPSVYWDWVSPSDTIVIPHHFSPLVAVACDASASDSNDVTVVRSVEGSVVVLVTGNDSAELKMGGNEV